MKLKLKFMFFLLIFMWLTGCANSVENKVEAKKDSRFTVISHDKEIDGYTLDIMVVEDKKTGCKYIMNDLGYHQNSVGGIYPLLNSSGNPTGCNN